MGIAAPKMDIEHRVTDLIRNKNTKLPTLPIVINNIIVTARSGNTSAKDLARFIKNDQAISARVLKIANSPYFGFPRKIDSISQAIVVVGFREILSIALGMSVLNDLSTKGCNDFLNIERLWKHSIAVGFAMKRIAKINNTDADEWMILVGLLHDIGKIIFCVYFPLEYREVLLSIETDRRPLYIVEREFFGLDHAEMAFQVMESWNFPSRIVQSVRYHHDYQQFPGEHIAMTASCANVIAHRSGIGLGTSDPTELDLIDPSAVGLSIGDIDRLAQELKDDREAVECFLDALK